MYSTLLLLHVLFMCLCMYVCGCVVWNRAYAIVCLRKLVLHRDEVTKKNLEKVFDVFNTQLHHDDTYVSPLFSLHSPLSLFPLSSLLSSILSLSDVVLCRFIYLNAIKGLSALGDVYRYTTSLLLQPSVLPLHPSLLSPSTVNELFLFFLSTLRTLPCLKLSD